MTFIKFVFAVFAASLVGSIPALAQQPQPSASQPSPGSTSGRIQLDVVVDTKLDQPVTNLHQQDFTILDNKSPRPITAFKLVSAKQEPVEVILLIDAVNTPFNLVAYMRDETVKFLKANDGKLAHPTTIAVLRDQGIQLTDGFSTDGNSLSNALQGYNIGLRSINRDSQWSENDRLALSIRALHQITTYASSLPGRKFIIWISPGYPLLSGPGYQLTAKQEQQVFNDIVSFSSQLRQARITLYDVNPIGVSQSVFGANYYQTFLKGVARPEDAQFGEVGIQVLSVQTGGLTIESNSDVDGMIERCLADADSWYEIAFEPPPADKPNEYHHIEVRLDQPGLTARTRTGYYGNPAAIDSPH